MDGLAETVLELIGFDELELIEDNKPLIVTALISESFKKALLSIEKTHYLKRAVLFELRISKTF